MGSETRNKWQESIPASIGSGEIILTGFGGGTEDYEGTGLNGPAGLPAGRSLTLVSGAGVAANGTYILVHFSTQGASDVVVTFATRGTYFGMNQGYWAYSLDGSNYVPVGENTASNVPQWGVERVDLSEIDEIENQPDVFLRYLGDGAMATASNTRIDNLWVTASGVIVAQCGDMDGDGALSMRDVRMAQRCLSGGAECELRCDIDGDGACTLRDVRGIYRLASSQASRAFACEAPSR